MKNITILITFILLLTTTLWSADRQFYFVGKHERLGSISNEGSTESGIYLRWDLIEGEFPSDIKNISLIRVEDSDHNSTLPLGKEENDYNVSSNEVMSPADIATLFQGVGTERRLFEVVDFISNNTNPKCSHATISNIGDKVYGCLESNYWSFLASRVNFAVAEARYRAYLDTTFDREKSQIKYILLGDNGKVGEAKKTIILGETTVLKRSSGVLPAKDFKQVIESRCNDNRYALDDGRIGLSWRNGGENSTEAFTTSIVVSGYDLYYSTKPASELPATFGDKVDIRKFASYLPHNSRGEVDLREKYHLAKANDTIITLGTQESDGKKPIYVESMEELKKRGFKVGEKRYYFLVPRDFTGNYGKTESLLVTIPDLLPPLAPINPRVIEKDGKAKLIWDTVNLKNYALYVNQRMKSCHVGSLQSKRVQFVSSDEPCQDGKGVMISFNVAKYYVYRFDNVKEAESFQDLDLDGYDDNREPESELCKFNSRLGGAKKYLVATVNHNEQVERTFYEERHSTKSREYWYRVVSVSAKNIISPMTAPIRVFVPKREILPAPKVTYKHEVFTIDKVRLDGADLQFALDTTSEATTVKIRYRSRAFVHKIEDQKAFLRSRLLNLLLPDREGEVEVIFYKSEDRILGRKFIKASELFNFKVEEKRVVVPDGVDEKGNPRTKISKTFLGYKVTSVKNRLVLKMSIEVLEDGKTTGGNCIIREFEDEYYTKNIENREGICMQSTRAMGNNRYKNERDCHLQKVKKICFEESVNEAESISEQIVTDSGLLSHQSFFTVIPNLLNTPQPNVPALVSMEISDDKKVAKVKFASQVEKVSGTMFYLFNKDKNITQTSTLTHIGTKPDEMLMVEINASEGLSQYDRWCVKAKTIAIDGQMSKWSPTLCQDATLVESDPNLLSWSSIENRVSQGRDFNISYEDNSSILIHLLKVEESVEERRHLSTLLERSEPRDIREGFIETSLNQKYLRRAKMAFSTIEDEKIGTIMVDNLDGHFKLNSEEAKALIDELTQSEIKEFKVNIKFYDYSNHLLLTINFIIKGEYIGGRLNLIEKVRVIKGISINSCELEKVSDFVVYRQTLFEDNSRSKFVQVSPLLKHRECKAGEMEVSNNIIISHIGEESSTQTISYLERYPFIAGEQYQYMLLFFDKESGEPTSYSLTYPLVLKTQ